MDRTRLIVTRKSGQSLWIGDARVKLELHGGKIRVVVEAPEATRVIREELRTRAA